MGNISFNFRKGHSLWPSRVVISPVRSLQVEEEVLLSLVLRATRAWTPIISQSTLARVIYSIAYLQVSRILYASFLDSGWIWQDDHKVRLIPDSEGSVHDELMPNGDQPSDTTSPRTGKSIRIECFETSFKFLKSFIAYRSRNRCRPKCFKHTEHTFLQE